MAGCGSLVVPLFLISFQLGTVFLQDLGDDLGGDLDNLDSAAGGGGELLEEKSLGNCPTLALPASVNASTNATSVGTIVKMRCNEGYTEIGNGGTRTCQPTLTWSGKNIVCEAAKCMELEIKNAVANTTARTYGTVVKFTCIKDTEMKAGNSIRRCQADQQWSGFNLFCQRKMCKEVRIARARVNTTERTWGTVRKYECWRGMMKKGGDNIRRCQKNQKWTGKDLICKIKQCKFAPLLKNASIRHRERRYVGAVVRYSCKRGYRSHGVATIRCRPNLKWTAIRLKCKKRRPKKRRRKRKGRFKKCPPLKVNTKKLHVTVSGKNKVKKLRCQRGYYRKNKGRTRIYCRNGKWVGRPLACELRCSTRGGWMVHADVTGVSFKAQFSKRRLLPGSKGTVSCRPGFVQRGGDNHIVCRKDGHWSGKPILCRDDDDLTKDKVAFQSSSAYKSKHSIMGSAALAIDRRMDRLTVDKYGCSMTAWNTVPWLAVDLQAEYPISGFFVRNYYGRAHKLVTVGVVITNKRPGSGEFVPHPTEVCVKKFSLHRYSVFKYFKCKTRLVGRYAVIYKPKIKKNHRQLIVCVFGVVLDKGLTRFKPAFQSSTFMKLSARLAVDGDRCTDCPRSTCSATNDQWNPWWAADLKRKKKIEAVYLVYKTIRSPFDKLANFSVSVTNTKPTGPNYLPNQKDICYQQDQPMKSAEVKVILCKPHLSGRYLVVSIRGRGSLSLCEVMAYDNYGKKTSKSHQKIKPKKGRKAKKGK